ncbi:SDR family oxidoreductase [Nitratidesulfovibrio sp. SRB-5]|uniref:SDR family oxidoreductase n=1 Tax=Nitratidesulfovibrio sp. SRB-5 TaxID=2872636 RepID=UPI001CBD5E90|nr:SDR family oxidoreductase [Nitratidesulfovibrio sp. SRB-5]MBZ2173482.1 SDR family oxidoreductase [Nitratidesulfovibrio sp. SRB-5]
MVAAAGSPSRLRGPVLIAGGTCELGLALGATLAADGMGVALTARDAAGAARIHAALPEATVLRLHARGPERNTAGQDFTTPPAIDGADAENDTPETLPERARAALGEAPRLFVDLLHSRFECLLAGADPADIDLWAARDIAFRARLLRAVSRSMLAARDGRCVFVSSSAAERAAPGQGYYAAAKLAGEALYRAVGVELAPRGVTACSLRLGWLDAGRGAPFLQSRAADAPLPPTGRTVTVAEAVQTLRFLLTAPATAINATTLTCDGGFGALKPAS